MAISLPAEVVDDVNNSLMRGHPMIFVAVTPELLPTVSFRGTAQVIAPDALAIWVRNPESSTLLASIAERPTVVAVYSNMTERRFYEFTGQAAVIDDEATRQRVFDNSPELERERDPERTGAAVQITLSSVKGRGADGLFQLG